MHIHTHMYMFMVGICNSPPAPTSVSSSPPLSVSPSRCCPSAFMCVRMGMCTFECSNVCACDRARAHARAYGCASYRCRSLCQDFHYLPHRESQRNR